MRFSTVGAAFVLMAIPAIARAHAGNDDPNVVHACVNNGSNIARIVGVSGACRAGETPAHWSIAGSPGPQGAIGPQGPQGLIGPQGLQGVKGDAGIIGPEGPQGTAGARGDSGATGATGPQGLQGATGAQGAVGPQGETGAQGPQGVKGDAGIIGPEGPQGAAGIIGPEGPQGSTGAAGAAGSPGTPGSGATVSDVRGGEPCGKGRAGVLITDGFGSTSIVCDGATGPAGPTGATGPAGTGTAARAAPPCFDNIGGFRYVDCGNGTVTDSVTGLVWLKDANCFGEKTYEAANQAAAGLAAGQCGLTDGSSAGDWRLPTRAEWQATVAQALILGCYPSSPKGPPSMTDSSGFFCFSDAGNGAGSFFTGVQSILGGYYWSSNRYGPTPSAAWSVALNDVDIVGGVPFNTFFRARWYSLFVWPVRNGR